MGDSLQIDVWSGGSVGNEDRKIGLGDLLDTSGLRALVKQENNDLKSVSGDDSLSEITPRYKTELCRNFKEKAFCAYGPECQFAHGEQDLREVGRQHRYKTRRCQSYWIKGCCVYGPRCNFIHDNPSNNNTHHDPTPTSTGQTKQVTAVRRGGAVTVGGALPAKTNVIVPAHGSGRMGMYVLNDKIHWMDTYKTVPVQTYLLF